MKLSKEAREARNAYLRRWRKENPERNRELNRRAARRYWERQAQKARQKEFSE